MIKLSSSKEEKVRDFYDIPWDINANYSLTYNKGYKSSRFSELLNHLIFQPI